MHWIDSCEKKQNTDKTHKVIIAYHVFLQPFDMFCDLL